MQKKHSYDIVIVALMGKYVAVKSACIATNTSYHASCLNNNYYVFFSEYNSCSMSLPKYQQFNNKWSTSLSRR